MSVHDEVLGEDSDHLYVNVSHLDIYCCVYSLNAITHVFVCVWYVCVLLCVRFSAAVYYDAMERYS